MEQKGAKRFDVFFSEVIETNCISDSCCGKLFFKKDGSCAIYSYDMKCDVLKVVYNYSKYPQMEPMLLKCDSDPGILFHSQFSNYWLYNISSKELKPCLNTEKEMNSIDVQSCGVFFS